MLGVESGMSHAKFLVWHCRWNFMLVREINKIFLLSYEISCQIRVSEIQFWNIKIWSFLTSVMWIRVMRIRVNVMMLSILVYHCTGCLNIITFFLFICMFLSKNHRANVCACVQIWMYAIWLQWRAKQARKIRSRRWLLSLAELWNWEGRWLGEQMKAGSSVQGSTVISSGKNCGEGKVNASLLVSLTIFQ